MKKCETENVFILFTKIYAKGEKYKNLISQRVFNSSESDCCILTKRVFQAPVFKVMLNKYVYMIAILTAD